MIIENQQELNKNTYHYLTTCTGCLAKRCRFSAKNIFRRNVSVQTKYYYMDLKSPIHTIRHACSVSGTIMHGTLRIRILAKNILQDRAVPERPWTGHVSETIENKIEKMIELLK